MRETRHVSGFLFLGSKQFELINLLIKKSLKNTSCLCQILTIFAHLKKSNEKW